MDMQALWTEFEAAVAAVDGHDGEEMLPEEDPRLKRFFAAQQAIIAARPADLQGVAVQLLYYRWLVKDSVRGEAVESMFEHAVEQLTALAQREAT